MQPRIADRAFVSRWPMAGDARAGDNAGMGWIARVKSISLIKPNRVLIDFAAIGLEGSALIPIRNAAAVEFPHQFSIGAYANTNGKLIKG